MLHSNYEPVGRCALGHRRCICTAFRNKKKVEVEDRRRHLEDDRQFPLSAYHANLASCHGWSTAGALRPQRSQMIEKRQNFKSLSLKKPLMTKLGEVAVLDSASARLSPPHVPAFSCFTLSQW